MAFFAHYVWVFDLMYLNLFSNSLTFYTPLGVSISINFVFFKYFPDKKTLKNSPLNLEVKKFPGLFFEMIFFLKEQRVFESIFYSWKMGQEI